MLAHGWAAGHLWPGADGPAAGARGGGLGGFAGQAAGIFADPMQVLTLPLGAGRMAGTILSQVLRTAAIEASVAGATQAAVEMRAAPYRASLGLPDDGLAQVAMAAAGGAVIGGGLRGLIAGVERLAGRGGRDAEAALAAARAEAQAAAARPGPAEQQAAHDAAARQTMGDLLAGERPAATLPPPVAPPAEAMRLAGLPEPELRAHVRGVVDAVLSARGGARVDGAWRPDLGAITIEWGDERAGLSHIIARRAADGLDGEAWIRDVLPEVLTQGRITRVYGPEQGRRVDLQWNGNRVVLSLFRSGQRENWVLSGFPLDGGPGGTRGVNPAPPYAPAPSGIRATAGAGPRAATIAPAALRFNTYTPTGRAVLVEPRVVSLRTLVPSHDADGRLNPAYPHAEGVQPRDRSAAPSSEQVRQIVAGFQIRHRWLPRLHR